MLPVTYQLLTLYSTFDLLIYLQHKREES